MKAADAELTPADRVHDHARIDEALAEAVREAVEQHRRAGNPVAIWRDGRVCWIEARDIPAELAAGGPDES